MHSKDTNRFGGIVWHSLAEHVMSKRGTLCRDVHLPNGVIFGFDPYALFMTPSLHPVLSYQTRCKGVGDAYLLAKLEDLWGVVVK